MFLLLIVKALARTLKLTFCYLRKTITRKLYQKGSSKETKYHGNEKVNCKEICPDRCQTSKTNGQG